MNRILPIGVFFFSFGCGPRADLVLTGGLVWTAESVEADPTTGPSAVAVTDGRIIAVGTDEEIGAFIGLTTRRIDLEGRRVVPGFIDNHTHFIAGGFALAGVQLRDAQTPTEFSRRIAAFAREHPGEWITGGTWDHELWGGELPRRDWIDSVTPHNPVFVTRLDGHMALANSRAMELAGISDGVDDVTGGEIERYPDGRPSGVLKDAAQGLVFSVIPEPSNEARDRAFLAAAQNALTRGVTMITDMGDWASFETYRRALSAGVLLLRVYSVLPIGQWDRVALLVATEGWGDDRLMWGGVKGVVDGSLGSTTAWFYDPYDDEPDETGFMAVMDSAAFHHDILASDSASLHVMVHAIGDRANDWLLDVFAEGRDRFSNRDRRFRIEHAQHLTLDAIERYANASIIASMQPYHVIDDGRWAQKRIGPERIKTTYAFRALIDAGVTLTFGSDWMVAPIDPLLGIYGAVTRRTIDGANPEGWVPQQKISVAEAVHAYTAANAFANFRDDDLGSIAVGKLADFAILSDDIFSIPAEEIETVLVDLTIINGEVVFDRPR